MHFGTLRNLLAKALGLPALQARDTVWERAVRRWKPLQYTDWALLAVGLLFLVWLSWMVFPH